MSESPTPNVQLRGAVATPFVAPEELERRLGRPFRVRLGANESVFGPSPEAIAAMQVQSASGQWYGDPTAFDLRTELARTMGGTIDHYVVGPGIDGLLIHLARAFLDRGSRVATTFGSYPTFEYAVRSVGGEFEYARYSNGALDLDELALRSRDASVVYMANPDNPSGSLAAASDIASFRASLAGDKVLILDEAYADFVSAEELPPIDFDDRSVVRLRTFSKAHGMAGLRVAYAIGHPETIGVLNQVRGHFEVSSVALAGALASFRHPNHVQYVVEATEIGRQQLKRIFGDLGLAVRPTRTNFVLVETDSAVRAATLLDALLQRGVFVRKPAHPPLNHCIRVTIGRSAEHAVLEEALANLI